MTNQFTDEQIFRDAWHEADSLGLKGGRVTAGLAALRQAGRLAAAGVAPQAPPAVHALIDEAIAAHAGQISTHYESCYLDHAGCLAVAVKGLLGVAVQPSSTVDEIAVVVHASHRKWCLLDKRRPEAVVIARAVVEAIGGEGR